MDKENLKSEIRNIIKLGSLVLILLSVFLLVESLGSLKDWRSPSANYSSINVVGKGEAVTVPDISTFNFTVSVDSKTVSEAESSVTTKMNIILAGLKDLGIEEKDIDTVDYAVWPKYTYVPMPCIANSFCGPSRQVADGYTVNHTVKVKVRKIDDAGKALSIVGDNGATNISGLSFTTDDPEAALNEARLKAIENAKVKAEGLAKELGVKLVRVVGYSDASSPIYPMYAESSVGNASLKAMDSAASPTLPVGENKATVNVNVQFEIR